MEEIYRRDLENFAGPKRRAREAAFRKFRAIITFWSMLALLSLASVTILPTANA